jgi:hypothetical protein
VLRADPKLTARAADYKSRQKLTVSIPIAIVRRTRLRGRDGLPFPVDERIFSVIQCCTMNFTAGFATPATGFANPAILDHP